MFTAVGVEASLLRQLRAAATTAEVRLATGAYKIGRVLGPVSLLLLLAPGFYLAAQIGEAASTWVGPSLGAVIVIVVVGAGITGRKIVALERALPAGEGALGPELRARAADAWLRFAFAGRAVLLLAVLLLMIWKPT